MPTCDRHKDIPENVELADEMWLDHFLHCIPDESKLKVITGIRQSARIGHACFMANHQGTINSQARYTAKLLAGIRELLEQMEAADLAVTRGIQSKLKELIS